MLLENPDSGKRIPKPGSCILNPDDGVNFQAWRLGRGSPGLVQGHEHRKDYKDEKDGWMVRGGGIWGGGWLRGGGL